MYQYSGNQQTQSSINLLLLVTSIQQTTIDVNVCSVNENESARIKCVYCQGQCNMDTPVQLYT